MKRSIFISVLKAGLISRLLLVTSFVLINILSIAQTVQLDGSLSKDPENGPLTYKWRLISGPGTVTFSPSSNVVKPTVTGVWAVGIYKFELEVTDNGGLKGLDTMMVTVNQSNASPKANAGSDQTITLPASIATIGQPDGPGLSVQWVKVSGPQGVIKSPTQSVTDITGLVKGQYVFRKTVRNSSGLTGSDDVIVTVKNRCFWLFQRLGWC